MLYTKQQPVGVDIPIQKLQSYLHEKLPAIWGISPQDYHAYGRCYRNQRADGYVAEVYTGSDEYQEVYVDDRHAAVSFFGFSGATEVDRENTASIHLIFFVNLKSIKPHLAHRGDEEARLDVHRLVKSGFFGFDLKEITTGIELVLIEYGGTTMAEQDNLNGLYGRDMHPFHAFRFDFELRYNTNNC